MKKSFSSKVEIHPAIRTHLASFGLSGEEGAQAFLNPKLDDLPSPFLLASMDTAVDLIIDAIRNNDDILIWGDYDVDGITGTSLLYLFFQQIGVSATVHVPNRLTEGYGLNSDVLRGFSKKLKKNKLLITVDCGISNAEELLLAKKYGFKTIVTDHHQVPETELYGDATINPKRSDSEFPFRDLAGVGVAFYLAAAVRSKVEDNLDISISSVPSLKPFLGYVALGTIADIMPLTGVNRVLVKGGFEALSEGSTRTLQGLNTLFNALGVDPRRLTSDSISFKVAPAINAAGRLGDSAQPLRLLTSTDHKGADKLASGLIQSNNRRKQITEQNFNKVLGIADKLLISGAKCVIALGDFHEGVLGIVASRIVERFGVPALVCCYQPDDRSMIKGSGRAPEGCDLHQLMVETSRYLKKFGGHQRAAGFSLATDNYLPFKESFETLALEKNENIYNDTKEIKTVFQDLSLSESLDRVLLDNLQRLEPTGEGNPKPLFVDRAARFVTFSTFGKNRVHLKGVVRGKYSNIPVIGFNLAEKIGSSLNVHEPCRIVYNHSLETFNGRTSWRIHIQDIGPS